MQTILTDGHFLKNYLLTIFNGKDTWKFDKKFIKYYDENCDKGYIFQVDVEYHKELQKLQHNLSFLLERMKIKSVDVTPFASLCTIYMIKKSMLHT